MQTLNLLDSQAFEYNTFKVLETSRDNETHRKLALMEQLQSTLELDKVLNIFAMDAAKYVDFCGLCFTQGSLNASILGSRQGKAERQFELKRNNKFLGTLTYSINAPISLKNYKMLSELHQYLINPIFNAIQYKKAMALAMHDSLTELGNRRYYDQQIKRAMHHANRQQGQVGLLVCDLNKFKLINDTYGHHIGDEILKHFADALSSSVRDSDSVFRFGGDEFVVIVEDASERSLDVIENRIQQALENGPLLSKYNVSCSLGYTFMNRTDNEHSFFERADKALYSKKLMQPNSLSLV